MGRDVIAALLAPPLNSDTVRIYEVHHSGWHLVLHLLAYFGPQLILAGLVFFATRRSSTAGGWVAAVSTLLVVAAFLWPIFRFAHAIKGFDMRIMMLEEWAVFNVGVPVLIWLALVIAALRYGGYRRRRSANAK